MKLTRWRGHLDKLFPKPSEVQKVTHHPAMPYDHVVDSLKAIQDYKSLSYNALQLLILTATRTSEVLNAEGHEIDLNNTTLTITAERIKVRREHRVPLSH
ncbi:MAG TPA: tyrosine-type recombinase/integrase [Halomonas sp.]|nr:tyrosine-type recombinase/integrase [Halomonas sp.]